jgi:hypothetical protein
MRAAPTWRSSGKDGNDMNKEQSCCCGSGAEHKENCIICGKPLIYRAKSRPMECAICHKVKETNAWCEDGHYVCDACHSMGSVGVINYLANCEEKDPIKIFLEVAELPYVHMHGPEHHSIVPCVLLTAYYNCGGDIDLNEYLMEAWKRGRTVPGGACGFLGVCGAASGTGIYISLLVDASPLNGKVWDMPQRMTIRSLESMVDIGGPRCCKRTSRFAIAEAAAFTKEHFGVEMPLSDPACTFYGKNKECLHGRCPFFPKPQSGQNG